jgi:ABC-2 type transport system permease protein
MSVAYAIARRELGALFFSPIAYVLLTIFLMVCGYLFWSDFTPGAPVAMRGLFEMMVLLMVFVIPVLSMGAMATEFDKGTIESLMTAPVSETQVVVGKFVGALGFFLLLLAPTLAYVALLMIFGTPDVGPILSGYLGIVLVGTLFMSIGLFCSSLTRSQVAAAVMCAAVLFLITIVPWFAAGNAILGDFAREVVRQMVFQRYTDFARGVIDLGSVVFFLAGTGVFLFLTVKVLESRRWR